MGVITGALATAVVASEVQLGDFAFDMGLAELGPWGLLLVVVAFVFTAIFRGWIIVKLHYDTLLARAVAAEEANTRLSETNSVLVNTNDVQARTIEKQTAVGDTVERVMGAIQNARETAGGSS